MQEVIKNVKHSAITAEYFKGNLEGILIDSLDKDGELLAVYFLPCTKDEVEEWILENGNEDSDFIYEECLVGDPSSDFYMDTVKILCEDAFDNNINEYALAHREKWVQEQE